jgi:hypothetical protein|nr:hypothetical protein Q903MT_gene276 [Picea sitchensis]
MAVIAMPMDLGPLAWLFHGGVNKAFSLYWGKSVFLPMFAENRVAQTGAT